ncbi:MAG: efflux RND transporter periplasmic adaptor subunit [Fusobacteriaceae bacterium]
MKKIFLVIFIIISMLVVSCGKKDATGKNAKNATKTDTGKVVKTQVFEPKEIIKTNVSSGVLMPLNENTVVSITGGTVKKLYAKNGDFKKKGSLIVEIEDQATTSSYLSAKESYLSASTNFNKMKKLRTDKIISEDEYLAKKVSFTQAQSNYFTAKDRYDNLKMTAKMDGLVTDLSVKQFEKISALAKVFTVVDDKKMYIASSVSVEEINGVKLGNKAEIIIEGIPDVFYGEVYEVNPVAQSDTKKYEVKVAIDNKNSLIKKGMYATATIETGAKKGFIVPKSAIVVRDLFSYIFLNENGVAKEIKVERGYAKDNEVEVISPELVSSVEVIIDGQYLLENKDKINIVNANISDNNKNPDNTEAVNSDSNKTTN